MPLTLNIRRLIVMLVVIACLFVVLTFVLYQCENRDLVSRDDLGLIPRLVDVNQEQTLPTFYASLLILMAGALLYVIASLNAGSRFTRHWFGLSFLFLYLAIDETMALHEMLVRPTHDFLQKYGLYHELVASSWVVPGLLFAVVVAVIYVPFLWNLPKRTSRLFVISGGIYVGGAVGLEILIYTYWFHYQWFQITEEFFEMMGMILFIYALLDYLRAKTDHVIFKIV